jgi:hypothetical protein
MTYREEGGPLTNGGAIRGTTFIKKSTSRGDVLFFWEAHWGRHIVVLVDTLLTYSNILNKNRQNV